MREGNAKKRVEPAQTFKSSGIIKFGTDEVMSRRQRRLQAPSGGPCLAKISEFEIPGGQGCRVAKTEGIKATAHEKSVILLGDVAAADLTSVPPKLGPGQGVSRL